MFSRTVVHTFCLGLTALWLLLPAHNALAQSEPATIENANGIVPLVENGKRIYEVQQFARFAPQSAADIVAQIPGFSITNVSNARGLGEASQNVLINGQRITGKNNDALTVLRRIPVAAIRSIEIVDGATLDISGLSGDVLNVVAEQGSIQGNYAWRPQFREQVGAHWPEGEANVSGKSAIGDFALGFRWDGFKGGGWGGATEYRPATDVSFWRAQEPRFQDDIPKLSGSLNRTLQSGSIWNINASVDRENFTRDVPTYYQVPGEPEAFESSTGENEKWHTEVGTDYEFALGKGRLKLIGFYTQRWGPNVNELTTLPDGATVPTGSRFSQDSTEGERVLRGEYRWHGWDADWSLSGEAAYNFVDVAGVYEELDANGEFQVVPIPGASSRVEEKRGETILSFSRSLNQYVSLQVNGGVEYSVLSQDGLTGLTRSFWRPKGLVSLAWNPPSDWEFNFKLQRKVGQLNFFDFLASVNVNNDNFNGSNPDLVPPESWLATAQVIRNLGPYGKVKLTLEAEDITNIVSQVPIGPILEAPGNLPKATRLQATLEAGLLLDGLGIPGGKLDTFLTVRDTSVIDPLFGTARQLNGNCCYFNADFRQDVPDTAWTWGLFAEYQSKNYFYRLDYEERFWGSKPFGVVFLEHKNVFGMKVRFSVANLFNSQDRTESVNYVQRRDGPVDYTRDYTLTYHPFYRLQISGTF
ncbi:MAG: TonB-dependent receptor plug domain-containing protein [Pseudomonadota bacterium]